MSGPTENPIDALNALLEERSRYERWLEQLATRREQTPTHVFERVRTDYTSRLDGVMVQLRSRGAELEGSAASLEERVNALLAEETARRDARAEAELRALVGEYSQERADAELASCDADIHRLEGERNVVSAELKKIQEILALVRQPASSPVNVAPPAPPAPAAPPAAATPAPAQDETTFDELAFLQSVVDQPTAPVEVPQAANGPIGSVMPDPQSAAPPQPPRTSAPTPGATPSFLKDMPTEQVKTLKCQECGTMNYPTEWYCERCGGELAAM